VGANQKLIEIFKRKIQTKLAEILGGEEKNVIPAPACGRQGSRNPEFPVKTGIQFFLWFPAFAGTGLDSRFRGSDICLVFLRILLINQTLE
jgi:hypothetical protein